MAGDLYIQYDLSDTGSRPIPPGARFYLSPSIWLTDQAGTSLTEAKVGEVNLVHVQVNSLNPDPRLNVVVQVWVCDYTGGYIGPDAARASSGGVGPGLTGGVPTIVTAESPGVAVVPWTPTEDDLINQPDPTRGHVCIGANVYNELTAPPEGARLCSGRLDVPNDQHHAWKNITVVKTQGTTVTIPFRVVNPGPEPAEFVLGAFEVERDAAMGPLEQEHLLMDRCVDLVGGGPPPDPVPAACLREPRERTRLAEGGQLVLRCLPDPVPLRPARRRAKAVLVTQESADQRVPLLVRPGQQVPVVLTVQGGGELGEVHTVDVVQEDTTNGLVVGGGRVVVVQTPEWSC
jgi:hypothetical protein